MSNKFRFPHIRSIDQQATLRKKPRILSDEIHIQISRFVFLFLYIYQIPEKAKQDP